MKWGVISDASWANAKQGKTQAGHMLVVFHEDLMKGERAKMILPHWRSGKLQRTVGSTLAAETQSLARGVGDLLWMLVMYLELTNPEFELRQWRKFVKRAGHTAFSKFDSETLGDAVAIVDAKSFGGQDRRNALDIQALREELQELRGKIKWIERMQMPADVLMKKQGRPEPLKRMLREGEFGVADASAALSDRRSERDKFGYNRR